LIDLIREELLKSCELTGIWEKKLRDIEHRQYDAQQFIDELKAQVSTIVSDVMSDPTNRRVPILPADEGKKRKGTGAKGKGSGPKGSSETQNSDASQ
jgi:DNA topoisomerase-3